MTIDEAIKHCNENAEKEKLDGNDNCSSEHIQLRDWLIELEEYRSKNKKHRYEKKIALFVHKIKKRIF